MAGTEQESACEHSKTMSRFFGGGSSKKENKETAAKGPEIRLPYAEPPSDDNISRKPARPEPLTGDQLSKFQAVLAHQSNPNYVLPGNLKDLKQWKSKSRYHRKHDSQTATTSECCPLPPVTYAPCSFS